MPDSSAFSSEPSESAWAAPSAREWATAAVSERRADWAADRVLDPGDSHDKGEPSLCVGEAA